MKGGEVRGRDWESVMSIRVLSIFRRVSLEILFSSWENKKGFSVEALLIVYEIYFITW